MRIAIMQPYFLPYIGYWQLMNSVDGFVLYDDIKYTKKGWINRNRFLLNEKPATFSIPLRNDSDALDIRDRELSESFRLEKEKMVRRIDAAYRNAPYFEEGRSVLSEILSSYEKNLFRFLYASVECVRARLDINCEIVASSVLKIPRYLKGQDRVMATCKAMGATSYVNPIGGKHLYEPNRFSSEGIELQLLRNSDPHYAQFGMDFVPSLSILDRLMFQGGGGVREVLDRVKLV